MAQWSAYWTLEREVRDSKPTYAVLCLIHLDGVSPSVFHCTSTPIGPCVET